MSLKKETEVNKLVSILTTSMLVTISKKKAVKNAEDGKNSETTAEAVRDSENQRSSLTQVPYI